MEMGFFRRLGLERLENRVLLDAAVMAATPEPLVKYERWVEQEAPPLQEGVETMKVQYLSGVRGRVVDGQFLELAYAQAAVAVQGQFTGTVSEFIVSTETGVVAAEIPSDHSSIYKEEARQEHAEVTFYIRGQGSVSLDVVASGRTQYTHEYRAGSYSEVEVQENAAFAAVSFTATGRYQMFLKVHVDRTGVVVNNYGGEEDVTGRVMKTSPMVNIDAKGSSFSLNGWGWTLARESGKYGNEEYRDQALAEMTLRAEGAEDHRIFAHFDARRERTSGYGDEGWVRENPTSASAEVYAEAGSEASGAGQVSAKAYDLFFSRQEQFGPLNGTSSKLYQEVLGSTLSNEVVLDRLHSAAAELALLLHCRNT